MAQASAEKLEHTGPSEKERVASAPRTEQLAGTPESPFLKGKRTEPSVQIVGWERAKLSESHTLTREKGGSDWEHGEERVTPH